MGEGENLLYNLMTLIFVVLTLLVAIFALSIATGSADPPGFLAPADTEVPPTPFIAPTIPPSPMPGAELTPTAEVETG
ncbi:MAG: hypothetical protein JXQ72_16465, partial [Anaerolineae bacterium]|nr:hypothetical protein [Anaerolineae bacterium]